MENARSKAEAVAASAPAGATVLGVDTVVTLSGLIFGKPENEDLAIATLRTLSGHTHEVISGLALARDGEVEVTHETTRVTMRTVTEEVLQWYLATGEWRDRAGGYAVQGRGAALVTSIDGDYLNVAGLPVAQLLARMPGLLWGAR